MTSVGSHAAGSPHDAASTALKGASLAFQKKAPPPPPPSKDNGALTAATASAEQASVRGLGPQRTGSTGAVSTSAADVAVSNHDPGDRLMPTRQLGVGSSPLQTNKVDTKSPSFIAATLAASRSASPSPRPRGASKTQGSGGGVTPPTSGDAVDSVSIAPTGSLISMFERGGGGGDGNSTKRRSPRRSPTRASEANTETQRLQPELKTPTQQSSNSPTDKTSPQLPKQKDTKSAPAKEAPAIKPKPPSTLRPLTPPSIIHRSSPELVSPRPRRPAKPRLTSTSPEATSPRVPRESKPSEPVAPKPTKATKPSLPPVTAKATPPREPREPRLPQSATPKINKATQPDLSPATLKAKPRERPRDVPLSDRDPQKREVQQAARAPTPPKPRRTGTIVASQADSVQRGRADSGGYFPPSAEKRRPATPRATERPASSASNSSDDTFVSASSVQSPSRSSPPALPMRRRTVASAPSSPTRENPPPLAPRPMRHNNTSTSTLPLESLTTAIVAGSLASANLTPHHTGSTLPAPPLPKRQKSPRLLQTLRQPQAVSDDESDRHKKSHLRKFRGGKHAHHEGSRKRWREEITERERKRYEAVWASNRGLLLTPHNAASASNATLDTSQYVANIVVREIWRRSRLPQDELAEVWDLVDRQQRGMLSRQEFVVGMWLIDQRLRGRKIPHRVSDSVWGSANGVHVYKPKVK